MAAILNIETATDVCSVCLSVEGEMRWSDTDTKGRNHATVLGGMVSEALDYARQIETMPEAIAVSIGPGSYTGLRIGLSEAKGLAFGLGVPHIAVPTLKILSVAVMFSRNVGPDDYFAPMIDARRMDVFAGVYDLALNEVVAPQPMTVTAESFADVLDNHRMFFVGNGADKVRELISHPNAEFVCGMRLNAVDMIALSEKAFREGDFADVAYVTPAYLKQFQATTPRKNVLINK